MIFEQKTVLIIYKKLVAFYPPEFREQFGESMKQTFSDVCREHKREFHKIPLGLLIWMFMETSVGIIKEHFIKLKRGKNMENFKINFKSATIIGLISVLPFITLELVNRRTLSQDFPFPLFVFLWLLATAFIFMLMPIVQTVQTGNKIAAKPAVLLISGVFMVIIAFLWGSIVVDQMPCFMGVPNCD